MAGGLEWIAVSEVLARKTCHTAIDCFNILPALVPGRYRSAFGPGSMSNSTPVPRLPKFPTMQIEAHLPCTLIESGDIG